uniref:RNA cytidine acetyltransferase n=1 Tax=Theileria annulata TaxID=5874 RepID=A0A3B0MNS2_THEAN
MKKKVSGDIRALVEHCVSTNERCLFLIVGDKSRFQVANLHYLLQRVSGKKPNVLWCYKKSLEVSSHQKKRQKLANKLAKKGLYDETTESPYELFLRTTDIKYVYYRDSQKVLGQTFSVLVLQDFEALTPNVLCRTIETVEGGGIIFILLRTMESLEDLYNITMDAHSKLCSYRHDKVEPRFVRRFVLSLSSSKNTMVVDDELNILPICKGGLTNEVKKDPKKKLNKLLNKLNSEEFSHEDYLVLKKLSTLAVTYSQLKSLISLLNIILEESDRKIVTILSDRGRGKSATIGLFLSSALQLDFRNILIVAPNVENVSTLFDFLQRGLKCLGIDEYSGYTVTRTEGYPSYLKLNKRNSGVKFMSSTEIKNPEEFIKMFSWDILIIEEAASIPLPVVETLSSKGIVIISSTTGGYEGTGRSISLKLIQKFKKTLSSDTLSEITLKQPIRYARNDPIESWLNSLLCLNTFKDEGLDSCKGDIIVPQKCKFLLVNRNLLFSNHPYTEQFLKKLTFTLTSSHYRNSPDDLLLLSDAPAHKIMVLAYVKQNKNNNEEKTMTNGTTPNGTAPENDKDELTDDDEDKMEEDDGLSIMCVLHVSLEGSIGKEAVKNAITRGAKPSGDLIPWTIAQHFCTEDFGQLNGIRIVRIAVPQSLQSLGYGSETIKRLIKYRNLIPSVNEDQDTLLMNLDDLAEGSDLDKIEAEMPIEQSYENMSHIHYIGTCFGVSSDLVKFWTRVGFSAIYMRQVPNECTGEFSAIMLLNTSTEDWLTPFMEDFKHRLLVLSGSCFRHLKCTTILSLLSGGGMKGYSDNSSDSQTDVDVEVADDDVKLIFSLINSHDLGRLDRYGKQLAEFTIVTDLIPKISYLYFTGKLNLKISFLQSCILLAAGSQYKSVNQICDELKMPMNQVMALLQKTVVKVSRVLSRLETKSEEI